MLTSIANLIFLSETSFLSLIFAAIAAVAASKLLLRRNNLPPGPHPAPLLGNWLQLGDSLNHRALAALAATHGDIFLLRMGPRHRRVVVSSPSLAKEVLLTRGAEFGSRVRSAVLDAFSGGGRDVLFAAYSEHWRRMKRVMTVSLFTAKAVREHRGAWEDEAARLVEGLKRDSAESSARDGVSLKMRLSLLMHNNVHRMLFGRRFESVDDPSFLELYGLNSKRSVLIQRPGYSYDHLFPALIRIFIRGYLKICREVCEKRLKLFDYYVQERKKAVSSKDSQGLGNAGIDHILEAEQKSEITKDDVLYLIENLNVAGIGTVARAIEWGIAELTNHPRVLKKLQLELDTSLGRNVQLTEPDAKSLPYLQAVIKEILRLHTIAPLLAPHLNTHAATLGGFHIPAESRVTINAWWLANNPAHWKAPEEFRPERFLEEEKHVDVNGNDFRYVPFGVGRRSCPGISVALPIIGVTLGRLVQNFDFLLPPGQTRVDTTEMGSEFSLHMSKPFAIILRAR